MLNFKHAVDYYKFLEENFFINAPYFKDDHNEDGELNYDCKVNYGVDEYINYQDEDCFRVEDSEYSYKFFPPVFYIVEDIQLLKFLINELVDRTILPELNQVKENITDAYQNNKSRKIKHQLRLLAGKIENTKEVIDFMIVLGEEEKNDNVRYNFVVDNFIITAQTIKEACERNLNELLDFVKTNCPEDSYRIKEVFQ